MARVLLRPGPYAVAASVAAACAVAAAMAANVPAGSTGGAAAAATPERTAGGAPPVRPAPPAAATGPALLRPALVLSSRQAAHAVVLGAAQAGRRLVSVGERGLIQLSDDNGATWRQAPAPTSATLTAVRFDRDRNGVAVGHAGVVLVTANAGDTWRLVLDGARIAELALAAAGASGDERALREAERLKADGADKPLLDVAMAPNGRLLVVGAYGLVLASEDGGEHWTPWMARLDNPQGLHLNSVRRRGDTILIGGERGLALLSRDGGQHFERLATPYQGSYFTIEIGTDGALLLAGLRGNAWTSTDGGRQWSQLVNPVPASITGSVLRADGTVVLASQAGMLLTRHGSVLVPLAATARPLAPLTGVLETPAGGLLALSVQGAVALGVKPGVAQ